MNIFNSKEIVAISDFKIKDKDYINMLNNKVLNKIVLTKKSRPVAIILPVAEYERITQQVNQDNITGSSNIYGTTDFSVNSHGKEEIKSPLKNEEIVEETVNEVRFRELLEARQDITIAFAYILAHLEKVKNAHVFKFFQQLPTFANITSMGRGKGNVSGALKQVGLTTSRPGVTIWENKVFNAKEAIKIIENEMRTRKLDKLFTIEQYSSFEKSLTKSKQL